jgi:chemotaxis protein methyltransferase CheR
MVQRTQQGTYGQLEINQGLPAALLVRYFERHGAHWRVCSELRRWVQARELNLAEPWPALPRFDAIFLRNVLIYFDLPTRQTILRRVRQVLRPDGGVLIGSGETTALLDDGWERVGSGASAAYRPVAGAGQAAGSAA